MVKVVERLALVALGLVTGGLDELLYAGITAEDELGQKCAGRAEHPGEADAGPGQHR